MSRSGAAWFKQHASNRRHAAGVGMTDARDVGIKPGLAKALRLGDAEFIGPPEHSPEECETFGCDHGLRMKEVSL